MSRRSSHEGSGRLQHSALSPRRGWLHGLWDRGREGRGGARKRERAACSDTEKEIAFSNWIGYVDPVKAKDTSTLEKFEKESGIAVDYVADINDNETFFAKLSPQLQSCKATGRDIFVLTDWMAAKMIDLGWIQKLDHSNMPNVDANLIEFLKSPSWDPERDYSVPWQSGMTGICYNSELTDPVEASRPCSPDPTSRARSSC